MPCREFVDCEGVFIMFENRELRGDVSMAWDAFESRRDPFEEMLVRDRSDGGIVTKKPLSQLPD